VGDEYGISYRPGVAAAKVSGLRNRVIWQSGSLLLSLVIFGALWAIWPDTFADWAPWFLGVSVVTGGGTALYFLIQWFRARADARRAIPGLAIGLNREGMMIAQRWLAWPEVGSMVVKPGVMGASSSLVTTARDSFTTAVPLELTDAMPASLDSVVRVLSAGRAWVDLSRLD